MLARLTAYTINPQTPCANIKLAVLNIGLHKMLQRNRVY
jgi:hypothetical protein